MLNPSGLDLPLLLNPRTWIPLSARTVASGIILSRIVTGRNRQCEGYINRAACLLQLINGDGVIADSMPTDIASRGGVNDIGICVRIGVATLSSYEHCSGDTELNVKVCMEILFVFVFIPADY